MAAAIWDEPKKKRKDFTPATKKEALIKAGGKCMNCHQPLKSRATQFDHKNNNPLDNSPKNCFVVCANCHGENTVTKKIKLKDNWGNVIGYKTIKKKVGYKKERKKKRKKIAIRDPLFGNVIGYRKAPRKRKATTKKKKSRRKNEPSLFGGPPLFKW